jgi:ribonuclease HI
VNSLLYWIGNFRPYRRLGLEILAWRKLLYLEYNNIIIYPLASFSSATKQLTSQGSRAALLLDKAAEEFTNTIQQASLKAIPIQSSKQGAKAWWTLELTTARKAAAKAFAQVNKELKQLNLPTQSSRDSEEIEFLQQQIQASKKTSTQLRNQYLQQIKRAKTSHWNTFLEKEDPQSIYRAMKYTKPRIADRIPQIASLEGQNQETFQGKCQAFKSTLYPTPPSAPEPNWDTYQEKRWDWPRLTQEEVALACSTTKSKAPGPDQISAEIINKAYHFFPDRFLKIYGALINTGYHPLCWKQATGIILKKPGKPDYTQPKAYRVISLLNCLGKTSERILANRLSSLAETTELLHHSQIGGRKGKSAIDAALLLTDLVQQERKEKRVVSTALLDVKGAFDYVAKNQLLNILFLLGLPLSLITWVKSFLEDRTLRLSFDGETEDFSQIATGIPQGSPISPILFLIYIRDLFNTKKAVTFISYIDDISISTASKSLKSNTKILKEVVNQIVNLGKKKAIQFDLAKTEIIHFQRTKKVLPDLHLPSGDIKEATKCTKWLGIWFDNTLSFKKHIQVRVNQARQAFHRLMRLANTERGLSPLAVRQIYMACVASISDYGSEVIWKGQTYISKPLETLQNQALRKILGAFKTSPIHPMEVEAALLPPALRMDHNLMKYALRVKRMPINHPIRIAIQRNNYQRETLEAEAPSQLERIEASIQEFCPIDLEEINHHFFPPWCLYLPYSTQILKATKEEATKEHLASLKKWENTQTLAIYSDASQLTKGKGIGVGLIAYDLSTTPATIIHQQQVNIGPNQLVYNGELEGATLALELAGRIAKPNQNIQTFVDNQAAILRLKTPSDKPGQAWQIRALYAGYQIKTKLASSTINWVPGHKDILGNEEADKAAKSATESRPTSTQTSFATLQMKVKAHIKVQQLEALQEYSNKAKKLNPHTYSAKFPWNTRKKMAIPPHTPRKIASAFYQLKLGHGYFRSYLAKQDHFSEKCQCGAKQTLEHLLLSCKYYT